MTDADKTMPSGKVKRIIRHKGPCQYEVCDKMAWAQGYCNPHYQKLKNAGVLQTKRIVGDPVKRFHASYVVNPDSGCWEWTGWIHPKGYGILPMGAKSKKVRAHRFSYELHFGPIPEEMDVLHQCDNRKCCCPDHLFLGDAAINMQDCVSKGRSAGQIGTNKPKLTWQMATNIRIMYARSEHSMQNIADIYLVDQITVSAIVKGKTHLNPGRNRWLAKLRRAI